MAERDATSTSDTVPRRGLFAALGAVGAAFTHQAVVTYDPSKVIVAQMIAAIATLRYTATPVTPKAAPAGA